MMWKGRQSLRGAAVLRVLLPLRMFSRVIARMQPVTVLLMGYAAVTVAGAVFLCLPVCQRTAVSFLDNLFTATSAVSTTGLVTKSTADDYSFFGQLAILLMIQVGGIGYMSIASFVILGQGKRLQASSVP
jgi:trk system potassium uptake protein TrkH